MNILILSSAFELPSFNPRLRSQCDYLTAQGHHIEVYTEPWDELTFEHTYPIFEIGGKNTKYFKWLFMSIYSLFTNYKERNFAYHVLWQSRKTKFDCVFCSTNSCFPLGAASIIANIKNIPLYVDIWDMQELNPTYTHYSWWHPVKAMHQFIYTRRRNDAIAQARFITTVSPQHLSLLQTINPHSEVIYNGFDPSRFYYQPTRTEQFRINFFGHSYTSQHIDMVLHVMEKFRNELPNAQWMFYSDDLQYNHIKHSRPNICGILPEEIMPDTLRQSSLVLLFNDSEDNGLNYEQFYQALGAERPMLFTDVPTGAIPDMLALTNAGMATDSIKDSMNYIRELYAQWEKQGYTHREITNKDLFNARLQNEHLEQILATCKK